MITRSQQRHREEGNVKYYVSFLLVTGDMIVHSFGLFACVPPYVFPRSNVI